MLNCEVCGSKNAAYTSKIEGALLSVCKNCVSGEIVSRPPMPIQRKNLSRLPEGLDSELIENFSTLVQRERQKKNLTRAELAKKISVQENLIARIENGWRPPLELVKRLERFLSVRLTESA